MFKDYTLTLENTLARAHKVYDWPEAFRKLAFAFNRVHLFLSFFIPFRHESLLVQIHFYYTRTRCNAKDFTASIAICSLVYFTNVQTNWLWILLWIYYKLYSYNIKIANIDFNFIINYWLLYEYIICNSLFSQSHI